MIYSQQQQHQQHQQQSPLDESISNLSFKSSLDTTDCTGNSNYDQYRMQTMSLDLGNTYFNNNNSDNQNNTTHHRTLAIKPHYDPMLQRGHTIARLKYNTISNASSKMFSDESYSSAKSDLSARSGSVTPTRFGGGGGAGRSATTTGSMFKTPRSASKASLSSSTYKVLQSPFANFKKLFRNLPRPFSGVAAAQDTQSADSHYNVNNRHPDDDDKAKQIQTDFLNISCQSDQTTIGNISISDSVSQISLNKSQSPPVCPPPPGELKSMSYMESANVNYSNYDDFTRARNERMARQQAEKSARQQNGDQDDGYQSKPTTNNDSDADSWQMTSLPVYYERNLTTVFEEKQASCELADKNFGGRSELDIYNNTGTFFGGGSQSIGPPSDFDDSSHKRVNQLNENEDNDITDEQSQQQQQPIKTSRSIQSLVSSSSTSDSALDFQQRQQQLATSVVVPSTPYRFSFGQPIQTNDQVSVMILVIFSQPCARFMQSLCDIIYNLCYAPTYRKTLLNCS